MSVPRSVRASFRSTAMGFTVLLCFSAAAFGQGATPTATPPITPMTCLGDCNGNGRVSVDELTLMVAIALGRVPLDSCPANQPVGRTTVQVSEVVMAIDHALHGCGHQSTPTPEPVEYGICYESSDCFPCDVYPCAPFSASREFCCSLTRSATFSWCPTDQFDSSSLSCAACEYPCPVDGAD